MRLDSLARFGQRDRITSMQQQSNIFRGDLLSYCPADSPAGAGDQISFHVTQTSCLIVRQASSLPSPGQDAHATESGKMPELRSPERKPIIRRFPEAQSDELLIEAIVDLRPKRPHNVFARRRRIAKLVGFEVQMSILPRCKRLGDCFSESIKILNRASPLIVLTANRCLRHIAVAMPKWIIAFAVKLRVLGIGETFRMQSMRSIEWHSKPEKDALVMPHFGKKIVPLVQPDAMQQRQTSIHLLVNVISQALRRYRTIL